MAGSRSEGLPAVVSIDVRHFGITFASLFSLWRACIIPGYPDLSDSIQPTKDIDYSVLAEQFSDIAKAIRQSNAASIAGLMRKPHLRGPLRHCRR
jgi:hypothetical protein